jgi:glycosyltransferase involved in cell wall biosynthesis
LRLAVVTPFVDRQHGTERALAELLDHLTRDHHCEIHLYAERIADLAVTIPSGAARTDKSGSPSSGSITWHRVPSLPGPHLFKFIFWIVANTAIRWWHCIGRNLRFDLVFSPGINCIDADFIVVHALFRRLQELSRGQSTEMSGAKSQSAGILRRLHRRAYYETVATLERIVYTNRHTRLAAVSHRTADLLAGYFGRNDVSVIYNGIDTLQFSLPARLALRQGARFRRKFADDELVLLLIGNDWRVKGLPEVLEAMATLRELPLRLIVVGSDDAAYFQRTAQQLGIADRCRWESPRADVIEFFAAADIYVSPTKEDSFGLPVAEAMACGLPVITSKFAGVSELIQNNRDGLILSDIHSSTPDSHSAPSSNPPALVSLLRKLHADSTLRKNLGESAAIAAQNWTWDRNATEIWDWLQANTQTR